MGCDEENGFFDVYMDGYCTHATTRTFQRPEAVDDVPDLLRRVVSMGLARPSQLGVESDFF
jgi:hypothetical protein